jgi:hypothetical protein
MLKTCTIKISELFLPPSLSPILIQCKGTKYPAQDTNFGTIKRPITTKPQLPPKLFYRTLRFLPLPSLSNLTKIKDYRTDRHRYQWTNHGTCCQPGFVEDFRWLQPWREEAGFSSVRSFFLSWFSYGNDHLRVYCVLQVQMPQWVYYTVSYVGFDVLTMMTIKNSTFWYITPCSLVKKPAWSKQRVSLCLAFSLTTKILETCFSKTFVLTFIWLHGVI